MGNQKIFDRTGEPFTVTELKIWDREDIVLFSMPTVESPRNRPEDWTKFLGGCTYFGLVQNGSVRFAVSHAHQEGHETHATLAQHFMEEKESDTLAIRLTQLKLGVCENWLSPVGASVNLSERIEPLGDSARTLIRFVQRILGNQDLDNQEMTKQEVQRPLQYPDEDVGPSYKFMVIDGAIRLIETPRSVRNIWGNVVSRIKGRPHKAARIAAVKRTAAETAAHNLWNNY